MVGLTRCLRIKTRSWDEVQCLETHCGLAMRLFAPSKLRSARMRCRELGQRTGLMRQCVVADDDSRPTSAAFYSEMTLKSSLRCIRWVNGIRGCNCINFGQQLKAGWSLSAEGCPSVGRNLQDGCFGEAGVSKASEEGRRSCTCHRITIEYYRVNLCHSSR